MLSGTYIYGMDRKGRLVMPSQHRRELGEPFWLTRAPSQCLLALAEPQWHALCRRYEGSVSFRGYYLAAAHRRAVDATTGRILIPYVLREYAGLRPMDTLAISGIGRAVQIATQARWEQHLQDGEFPSLGQMDLDFELPRAAETAPYRQVVERILGVPVIRCRGRMHRRAVFRLVAALRRELEQGPALLILDVRETGETEQAVPVALEMAPRGRTALWIVSERDVAAPGAVQFRDIEEVFWRLGEFRIREAVAA